MLIALEGIDGSGTTTQAHALAEALTRRGHEVLVTAEPSTGPIGRLIRRHLRREADFSPDTLALLFAADRLDHLAREILPALEAGKIVVTDRYVLSSLAYQSLSSSPAFVRDINARARPADLILFLRLSPEEASRRRLRRGTPEERFETLDEQRAIADAYASLLEEERWGRILTVDAALPEERLTEKLLEMVTSELAARHREEART